MQYQQRCHTLTVPLNYADPQGVQLEIFAREIFLSQHHQAPLLLYLQGGPGMACPRDIQHSVWLKTLLQHFRVLLLDQRGTGRSSKICIDQPQVSAETLQYLRADAIVQDAEQLRQRCFAGQQWTVLGQSFGGFAAVHYLCAAPAALQSVLITGGIPPLPTRSVSNIYSHLLEGIRRRNQQLYREFPHLIDTVRRVSDVLQEQHYPLGAVDYLTVERLRDVGILLGADQGVYQLAQLFDDPFVDRGARQLHWGFVKALTNQVSYETHPLYAVLHESIYCHGFASQWAADRVLQADADFTLSTEQPVYFYGETIRRSMFTEYGRLQPFRQAAEQLAAKTDWPMLYDMQRLANNTVPLKALLYQSDYYVDYRLAREMAAAIGNCTVITSRRWQHDALRVHAKAVLRSLLA